MVRYSSSLNGHLWGGQDVPIDIPVCLSLHSPSFLLETQRDAVQVN